jgi:hypothetical protein
VVPGASATGSRRLTCVGGAAVADVDACEAWQAGEQARQLLPARRRRLALRDLRPLGGEDEERELGAARQDVQAGLRQLQRVRVADEAVHLALLLFCVCEGGVREGRWWRHRHRIWQCGGKGASARIDAPFSAARAACMPRCDATCCSVNSA